MLAAHTIPEGDGDAVWDGRSSILFAVVAGISLGLLSAAPGSGGTGVLPRGARGRLAGIVGTRAALLVVLGLALAALEVPIAIILDTYGLLFAVSIPLLFAPRRVLAVVAALAAVAGPWVVTLLTEALDGARAAGGAAAAAVDSPAAYFPESWLTGAYPAPVWLAYLAAGILIARCGLQNPRTQWGLLGVGALLAAGGYLSGLLTGDPVLAHSDTTAEVVASGGLAAALVGLLLLLTTPRVSTPGPLADDRPTEHPAGAARVTTARATTARWSRRLLWPLAAVGSMPLTLYTAQLIAIKVIITVVPYEGDYLGWQTVPLFFALALPAVLFAVLWRLRFSQGPLEALFSRLTGQRPWRAVHQSR
jgi:hypothetical protein